MLSAILELLSVECPDSDCDRGYITIYNAYAEDVTKGERVPCPYCMANLLVLYSANEIEVLSVNGEVDIRWSDNGVNKC